MRFVPERILRCSLVTTNRLFYIAFADQSCLQNPMYAMGDFKMTDTNQKQEIEFAAFVGIDWADQKHAWALQIPEHRDVERGDLASTAARPPGSSRRQAGGLPP